jgi:hypothetical protein
VTPLPPTARLEGGAPRVAYRTPRPREVNPQAIARIVAAGGQIVSVTCETPTLEDAYAAAIGEAAASPVGAAG